MLANKSTIIIKHNLIVASPRQCGCPCLEKIAFKYLCYNSLFMKSSNLHVQKTVRIMSCSFVNMNG
jgi:hypothetical protein